MLRVPAAVASANALDACPEKKLRFDEPVAPSFADGRRRAVASLEAPFASAVSIATSASTSVSSKNADGAPPSRAESAEFRRTPAGSTPVTSTSEATRADCGSCQASRARTASSNRPEPQNRQRPGAA